MVQAFISIGILDIIDILIVAFLMYQVYRLSRGTAAINIFLVIFVFYLLWLLVKALNMKLLGSILGQVIGVGIIALIIVFQQELRRFLLVVSSRYFSGRGFSLEKIFQGKHRDLVTNDHEPLIETCFHLAKNNVDALIVMGKISDLTQYAETGDIINADFSGRLLESIFNKEAPLHDGAVIIKNNKIIAARCVLPITEKRNLPP